MQVWDLLPTTCGKGADLDRNVMPYVSQVNCNMWRKAPYASICQPFITMWRRTCLILRLLCCLVEWSKQVPSCLIPYLVFFPHNLISFLYYAHVLKMRKMMNSLVQHMLIFKRTCCMCSVQLQSTSNLFSSSESIGFKTTISSREWQILLYEIFHA